MKKSKVTIPKMAIKVYEYQFLYFATFVPCRGIWKPVLALLLRGQRLQVNAENILSHQHLTLVLRPLRVEFSSL